MGYGFDIFLSEFRSRREGVPGFSWYEVVPMWLPQPLGEIFELLGSKGHPYCKIDEQG